MAIEGLELSASHLRGKDQFEPQRSNNAMLVIDGLPGEQGDSKFVELAINTFSLPKSNHNPTEIHWLNRVFKYAGKRVYDDLTLELNQYVDRDIAAILYAWYAQVQGDKGPIAQGISDPLLDGALGLARDYKKDADIFLYPPNALTGEMVRAYELEGVWPQSVDGGEIDMSSDEPVRMSINLSIDQMRYLGNNVPTR